MTAACALPAADRPPLLFHHVPKTAGTAVVELLRANYGDALLALYDHDRLAGARGRESRGRAAALGIAADTRCVATHAGELVVPALPQDFRAFALLRHPLDRVVSLYYYARSIAERDPGAGGAIGRALLERGWEIRDVYLALGEGSERDGSDHRVFWEFFNGQSRHLLRPWHSTAALPFTRGLPGQAARLLEGFETLARERYSFGVQEEPERSVALFARRFGWTQRALERHRETADRPRLESLSEETRRLVLAHNQLDLELWRRARRRLRTLAPRLA